MVSTVDGGIHIFSLYYSTGKDRSNILLKTDLTQCTIQITVLAEILYCLHVDLKKHIKICRQNFDTGYGYFNSCGRRKCVLVANQNIPFFL
jgi:hypothetical protein